MSSAKALLERAAMCTEHYAVSERDERIFKLMALHIIDACGSRANEETAKLLMELLEG